MKQKNDRRNLYIGFSLAIVLVASILFATWGTVSVLGTTSDSDTDFEIYVEWDDYMRVNDVEFESYQACYDASIAVDSTGRIYVVWSDQREREYGPVVQHLYLSVSDDGGRTFSANRKLEVGSGEGQGKSSIGIGADDRVIICYQEDHNIYVASSDDGCVSFTVPVRINPLYELKMAAAPNMVVDGYGVIHIVWNEYYSDVPSSIEGQEVYYSKSMDGGKSFTDPVKVDDRAGTGDYPKSPSRAIRPALTVGEDGTIYVVWRDSRNRDDDMNWDIFMSRSIDGGNTFSRDRRVNTDTTNKRQHSPSAIAANDLLYISWSSDVPHEDLPTTMRYTISRDRGESFEEEKVLMGSIGVTAFSAKNRTVILASSYRDIIAFSEDGTEFASYRRPAPGGKMRDGLFITDDRTIYHCSSTTRDIHFSRGELVYMPEEHDNSEKQLKEHITNTQRMLTITGIGIGILVLAIATKRKAKPRS